MTPREMMEGATTGTGVDDMVVEERGESESDQGSNFLVVASVPSACSLGARGAQEEKT